MKSINYKQLLFIPLFILLTSFSSNNESADEIFDMLKANINSFDCINTDTNYNGQPYEVTSNYELKSLQNNILTVEKTSRDKRDHTLTLLTFEIPLAEMNYEIINLQEKMASSNFTDIDVYAFKYQNKIRFSTKTFHFIGNEKPSWKDIKAESSLTNFFIIGINSDNDLPIKMTTALTKLIKLCKGKKSN